MARNPQELKISEIRNIFKRNFKQVDFLKLVHFVVVPNCIMTPPGTYVVAKRYHNCVIIATDALCINDWLDAHDLPKRPKLDNEGWCSAGDVKTRKIKKFVAANGYSKLGTSEDGVMQQSTELQEDIMKWLAEGATIASISRKLGCSGANVIYHKKKYLKRKAEQRLTEGES